MNRLDEIINKSLKKTLNELYINDNIESDVIEGDLEETYKIPKAWIEPQFEKEDVAHYKGEDEEYIYYSDIPVIICFSTDCEYEQGQEGSYGYYIEPISSSYSVWVDDIIYVHKSRYFEGIKEEISDDEFSNYFISNYKKQIIDELNSNDFLEDLGEKMLNYIEDDYDDYDD